VDDYFSVNRFRVAYEGSLPMIPDKSMWPKATHGFFMHPPLLKSTGGRRKNRMKSAAEGRGGATTRRRESHMSALFVIPLDITGTHVRMEIQKI
jgi:hypothetical protein